MQGAGPTHARDKSQNINWCIHTLKVYKNQIEIFKDKNLYIFIHITGTLSRWQEARMSIQYQIPSAARYGNEVV